MRLNTGAAAIGVAMAMLGGVANAAEVFIQNADFEASGLGEDEYYGGHVRRLPGWDRSGGSGTGEWNPTSAHYSDHAAHGAVGWATGALAQQAGSGMIAQEVGGITLQANTRYTLTVDTGGYLGGGEWGYTFGLIGDLGQDGAILSSLSGFIDPATGEAFPLGTMRTISMIFETGATGDYLGKALFIALGGSGRGAAYDNVRLDVSALTPSAVPEPATWAMMIFGFGMVGAVARNRRRTQIAMG